ncbi:kinase [Streptomyces sp. NRRL S-350]|uniref:kinase n=1 Tax=Streptomyces sp. NRRL S-350 TaxID=1463902 RepID=UPI000B02455E|nr:kinase [Streptomyces sp. NRRL S-350]
MDHSLEHPSAGTAGTATGSTGTVLVVVRGPSGAGKSSTAARIRSAYGRGLAIVGQDQLRREVLRERDVAGGANIALIGLVARHALDAGFHTVVEGILDAGRYGPMLTDLVAGHRGRSYLYYLDIGFDETVRRHATRPLSAEVSVEQMAGWYRPLDLLPGGLEHVIGEDSTLDDTVARILADTALTPPGRTPRP